MGLSLNIFSNERQKSTYFHGFTTLDLILTVSIMFSVVSLIVPIIFNGIETSKVEKAQKEVKRLAHEAVFLPLVEESPERSIASEGIAKFEKPLGLDPWGHPYRKTVLKDTGGHPEKIVVWSTGPNGIVETINFSVRRGAEIPLYFGGDDFGTVVPLDASSLVQ